ncbi:YbaB/EbfC family nucleoid-associated protein [Actinokineospora iranica]|uniref:YbaB/EbfC DNA-binding family protein n=1 Tax=Actinokineospora iranica TaxID=1271860 RepID=A0A1G6QY32_9PSEU|nr:YbaB/EbfC family nucleoid-associated protein [Actinokineospora iranica]SDC97161.1 YbaB/EbfC DNA-binding family protein [Actinokineospora iranica]
MPLGAALRPTNHDELARAQREIQEQLGQLATLRANLRDLRSQAQSETGKVTCAVDGEGTILELRIARGSVRSMPAATLAAEIKEAIDTARQRQDEMTAEQYNHLFARYAGSEGLDDVRY